ncbi:MAG: DUF4130 domain-containing protein [Treponema sp.]|nr:DUF4130 domain-containing protein [Treponema sp.]
MGSADRRERALLAAAAVLERPVGFRSGPSAGDPSACPPRTRSGRGAGHGSAQGQLELGLSEPAGEDSGIEPRPEDAGASRRPGTGRDSRALRVERSLRALGGDVWESFEYALRTDLPVEAEASAFAVLALLCGSEAAADRSRPEVRAVRAAAFKVRREVHRLLGLLRFEPDSEGVYTAKCEPDNDVLDLLLPAFQRRFGSEPFRIVDLRRGSAAGSVLPSRGSPELDTDLAGLWRTYYSAAENPARGNPRLRLQYMPRRYWKHLPEIDA